VLDEVLENSQPIPRWFEIGSEQAIFDISVEPVDLDGLLTKEFVDVEVLQAAPATIQADKSIMLTEVAIAIYYYQKNRNDKQMILVEMEYGGFERMTEK